MIYDAAVPDASCQGAVEKPQVWFRAHRPVKQTEHAVEIAFGTKCKFLRYYFEQKFSC